MDNKQIARVLRETAQLLEIDGAIIGRYRSYEKAAELIDGFAGIHRTTREGTGKAEELPGIGDRMVEHLQEIVKTGDYALRKKLLKKYPATILDLLQLQSLGPKKVAFLWSSFKAATVADVEKLAKDGKLRDVPGFGEKSEQNILKAVEVFKKSTGRFHINTAEDAAAAVIAHIKKAGKAVESVTPAGSLRRGKETVGDLDLLVTLADGHTSQKHVDALASTSLNLPASIKRWRTEKTKSASRWKTDYRSTFACSKRKLRGCAALFYGVERAQRGVARPRQRYGAYAQ